MSTDAFSSLVVQFAAGVDAVARDALVARLTSLTDSMTLGYDLGHRGPEDEGYGHALTAAVIGFHTDQVRDPEELRKIQGELVAWLASAPVSAVGSLRVELMNLETGAVAAIDTDTPAEAAALLGPALGTEWTNAPMEWTGTAWSDGTAAPESDAGSNDGPKAKRVLAVADEWFPARGGLSAYNRYLCRALAAIGQETYCLVPGPSEQEIADAEASDVRLIAAPLTPGRPRTEGLMLRPELPGGAAPDVIIGHSWVTGQYARAMQDHFPYAARVHFIHMSADETPFLKKREKKGGGKKGRTADMAGGAPWDPAAAAEDRGNAEAELASGARLTACVGPTLHEWFSRHVHERPGIAAPMRLDPGFNGSAEQLRTRPPGAPRILVFGRLDDADIKGVDLAARAVGAAMRTCQTPHREVELLVRGARAGDGEKLRKRLLGLAACPAVKVLPRNFTTDLEALRHELRTSSLVLMPSRVEGFGLAGLEAIVSGTPTLISGASGLGRLLEELLSQDLPEMTTRLVVPVLGHEAYEDTDVDQWRTAITSILRDLDSAFGHAATVRSVLAEKRTWPMAAAKLLEELGSSAPDPAAVTPSHVPDVYRQYSRIIDTPH
jgi:glycosyltransferase involved in cell wall biosynthesis